MHNPKYDIFVTSLKNPNPCINLVTEEIMMKLYQQLRQRLNHQGFGNVVVDTMRYIPNVELEESELTLLKQNPFYLSEHYLTQRFDLDPNMTVINRWQAPWNTRPHLSAYTYVERGQRPMFHAMVIGGTNSGKTFILHEFRSILQEMVPGIEVIECDNDVKMPDYWDITLHLPSYLEYGSRIKDKAICIGNGPSFKIGFDNVMYHNTKI